MKPAIAIPHPDSAAAPPGGIPAPAGRSERTPPPPDARQRTRVHDTIAQMTAAMARGDEPAIENFYRRFFDLLYGHARRVSRRDESFCLDIVQEALLRIVRTIRPVAVEAALVVWLKLVVKSVAYDLLRGERRRGQREAARARRLDFGSGQPASRPTHDDHARGDESEERVAWLRAELLKLDPELVRLIELRYVEGWTLARIGRLVGLSTGTVDGRLRRVLTRMRQKARAAAVE